MANARFIIGATGGEIQISESTGVTGATGYGTIYVSSSDNKPHFVDTNGSDSVISLGSGSSKASVKITTPGTPHTGDTNETVIQTMLIPANTVKDSQFYFLMVNVYTTKTVSATTSFKIYINTTTSIGGVTVTPSNGLGMFSTTTDVGCVRYLTVDQADGSGNGTYFLSSQAPYVTTPSGVTSIFASIDWTVDQYIVVTGALSNASNDVAVQNMIFSEV